MVSDGRWVLHRYATGESLLHDLVDDPREQINRVDDPSASEILSELEAALTRQLIQELQQSVLDRRAATTILEMVRDGEEFGARGWRRPWPNIEGV